MDLDHAVRRAFDRQTASIVSERETANTLLAATDFDADAVEAIHRQFTNQHHPASSIPAPPGTIRQEVLTTVIDDTSAVAPSCEVSEMTPVTDLVNELELGKRLTRRYLRGTLSVSAHRTASAIQTVVRWEGNPRLSVRLVIYNMIPEEEEEEDEAENRDPDTRGSAETERESWSSQLAVGTRVTILEPYLKRYVDGTVGLRVDNPSENLILETPLVSPEEERQVAAMTNTPTPWRALGNSYFSAKKYADAARMYRRSIEVREADPHIPLSNLAEVALRSRSPYEAVMLARRALALDPGHHKSRVRLIRALDQLDAYDEALEEVARCRPPTQEEETAMRQLEAKLLTLRRQRDVGEEGYDWAALAYPSPSPASARIANYHGPLEVAAVEGKGLGVVATRDLRPGELLCVVNPVMRCRLREESPSRDAMSHPPNNGNNHNPLRVSNHFAARRASVASQTGLVTKLALAGARNPRLLEAVYKLDDCDRTARNASPGWSLHEGGRGGTFLEFSPPSSPINTGGAPQRVDVARLRRIVNTNAFSDGDKRECALYLTSALFNHACAPNACVGFAGENKAMIIRCARPTARGEEVCIAYFPVFEEAALDRPIPLHERRRAQRDNWGFECSCELCRAEEEVAIGETTKGSGATTLQRAREAFERGEWNLADVAYNDSLLEVPASSPRIFLNAEAYLRLKFVAEERILSKLTSAVPLQQEVATELRAYEFTTLPRCDALFSLIAPLSYEHMKFAISCFDFYAIAMETFVEANKGMSEQDRDGILTMLREGATRRGAELESLHRLRFGVNTPQGIRRALGKTRRFIWNETNDATASPVVVMGGAHGKGEETASLWY